MGPDVPVFGVGLSPSEARGARFLGGCGSAKSAVLGEVVCRSRGGNSSDASTSGGKASRGPYIQSGSVTLGHVTAIASHFQHMAPDTVSAISEPIHFVREHFSGNIRCCFLSCGILL